ncbi:uncharacterized protein LOC134841757 [Symsagittifera roscoffensis]|uniref:uncharacterized protein LOC134841757 n=1 Tax=Symsagittifera roscoffensis TaxID=84072 RepID=UPI00307B67BA
MSLVEQNQLAEIGSLVYQEEPAVEAEQWQVLNDEYDQAYSAEQEIEVELAIFSKGHGLLSPMQVFEIIFSETVDDALPEYPETNGYYVVSSAGSASNCDTSGLDLWSWSPFSTRNKLYYRCISKYNTIIAIEAYQEDAEDLTEAPKFYINKRDRSATDQGLLVRHYVDAVHIYRICRKADIHATNPNFRRHVMWIEAIEPNQQESPSKKVIEYMWKGKSKPDTLYGMQLETDKRIEDDNVTPRKKPKLDRTENIVHSPSPHKIRPIFKVHVSNLDPQVTDTDIQDLFSDFGVMKFHAVHYSKDCVSLCSAEVHYSSKQAVEAVVKQYNGVPLDGWPLCLASINQAGEIPVQDSSEVTTLTKVHVSNVGPEISDDRLSDLFSAVGGTKRCVVHHTASGKSLGTGEVAFETLTQAAEAIKKFDHTALEGWPLRLAIIGHSASADS